MTFVLPASALLLASKLEAEERDAGLHHVTPFTLKDWHMNVALRVYDPDSDNIVVYELIATNGHDSPRIARVTFSVPTSDDRMVIAHLTDGPQVNVEGVGR